MTEKWRWKGGGRYDWNASIWVFLFTSSESKLCKRQRCMCVYVRICLTMCDFRNTNWHPLCGKDRVLWGSQQQKLSLVSYLPLQSVMKYNSFWFGVGLVVMYWSRGEVNVTVEREKTWCYSINFCANAIWNTTMQKTWFRLVGSEKKSTAF